MFEIDLHVDAEGEKELTLIKKKYARRVCLVQLIFANSLLAGSDIKMTEVKNKG